jgi:hypothetical protein
MCILIHAVFTEKTTFKFELTFLEMSKIREDRPHTKTLHANEVNTAISIKVVPEQSGKIEYESRKGLLGIAKKFIDFLAIPSKPFALVFDFTALLGAGEIAACIYTVYFIKP